MSTPHPLVVTESGSVTEAPEGAVPVALYGEGGGGSSLPEGTSRLLVGYDTQNKPAAVPFRAEHWSEEIPAPFHVKKGPNSPGRGFWVPTLYEKGDGSKSMGWRRVSLKPGDAGYIFESGPGGSITVPEGTPAKDSYAPSYGFFEGRGGSSGRAYCCFGGGFGGLVSLLY